MKPWSPPSFDAVVSPAGGSSSADAASHLQPLLTAQEMKAFGQYPHQDAFLRGLQQGLEEGRAQGHALGRQEGWNEGHRLGYEAGLGQGLQDGADDVRRLSSELRDLVDSLRTFPELWAQELGELVFLAASRINGGTPPDRQAVIKTVLESLQAVPQPGQTLKLRLPPREMTTWAAIVNDPQGPIRMAAVADPDLAPGQAMMEIGSSRVDVGDSARMALLKSALGLLSGKTSVDKPCTPPSSP
jgi:flagellar assembly protein FliH